MFFSKSDNGAMHRRAMSCMVKFMFCFVVGRGGFGVFDGNVDLGCWDEFWWLPFCLFFILVHLSWDGIGMDRWDVYLSPSVN